MEQQNEVLTNEIIVSKVVVKKTIPQKQKTTIKLVMWALSHVMEREAMLVKIDEIFKLKDTSIETIIEMVDAVEKSAEYLVMETELGALRQKEKPRREKVTGDPDTIIKQLVDMAKDEVKPAKKTKKIVADADTETEVAVKEKKPRAKKAAATDGTETVVTEKKPRAKKVAADADTVKTKKPRAKKTDIDYSPERPSPAFLPTPVENLDSDSDSDESVEAKAPDTEKKTPKPRAKKVTEVAVTEEGAVAVVAEEDKKKPKPRAKKVAVVAAVAVVAEEDKKKPKPRAKKVTEVVAVLSEEGSAVVEDDKKKPKTKSKVKAKEEIPVVVHEVEESLEEDEYLLLNEVVVEGETYMVDSNQNIYDEFNKIIGKYDNGVVVLHA
jgi:hypothetical protein